MELNETELQTEEKQGKRSGKSLIVVIAVLLVVSIAGNIFLWFRYDRQRKNAQDLSDTYSVSYFHFDSITVDSFKKKVASGEEFIVLISRPGCPTCQAFEMPFIRLTEQKGINDKIYHLNVAVLRRDNEAWAEFKKTYGLEGTPTYARFAGGNNVSCVGYNVDYETVVQWIEEQSDFFAN